MCTSGRLNKGVGLKYNSKKGSPRVGYGSLDRHEDFLPPFTTITHWTNGEKRTIVEFRSPPPSSSPFSRPLTTTDDLHCIIASFPLPPTSFPAVICQKNCPLPPSFSPLLAVSNAAVADGGEGLFNGSIKGGGGLPLSLLYGRRR